MDGWMDGHATHALWRKPSRSVPICVGSFACPHSRTTTHTFFVFFFYVTTRLSLLLAFVFFFFLSFFLASCRRDRSFIDLHVVDLCYCGIVAHPWPNRQTAGFACARWKTMRCHWSLIAATRRSTIIVSCIGCWTKACRPQHAHSAGNQCQL